MTSIDVAQDATSPSTAERKPRAVLARELLWDKGTISIVVPTTARDGEFPLEDKTLLFLQFTRNIKNGVVNLFVHGDDLDALRGKEIVAHVNLFRKCMDDGKSYLYVDLIPTSGPATHFMRIEGGQCKYKGAFLAQSPLEGFVHFELINLASTGDSKLDQYIADGWSIKSEDTNVVYLTKEKDGKTKEMTHYKPKNKKNNKKK
jgi:hypothetical protein